jgi:uncharacterized protein (DUF486 family)
MTDRYIFQINRIPDLIFKYQNTMYALSNVFWVFTWSGSSSYMTNPVLKFIRSSELRAFVNFCCEGSARRTLQGLCDV